MANLTGLSALFRLRPDRAADYLAAKGFKLSGPYWEMDGPQHSHLFTVANLAKMDVLQDIRSAVQQALDEGLTEKWFADQLVDVLKAKGWWGGKDGSLRRLHTIYATNLQTALMAGRHRQAVEQADRRPWAQYLAIRDHRSRPAHAAMHGQIFRLDSPAWACIAPPVGYNCRCRARYLSDRDMEKRGLKPAEDIQILEREPPGKQPVNPLTGATPQRWIQRGVSVPSKTKPGERDILWADPGWDNIPGSDGAERMLVDRLMAKATDLGDGVRMAVQAGLREVADKVEQAAVAATGEASGLEAQATAKKADQSQRLSTQIQKAANIADKNTLASDWIDDHRTKKPQSIKAHGMAQAEDMVSVSWEGIDYWFKKGTFSETSLADLVIAMADERLPRRLTSATKRVIFSDQPNMEDAYWAVRYNDPNFVSLATGGDGTIVIYRNQPIDIGSLAHEMGHNLATKKWQSTSPSPWSDYGKAMDSGEPPPTNYAKNSPSEDFAESVRLYFRYPQILKNSAPKRYTVIKKIIESAGYGG